MLLLEILERVTIIVASVGAIYAITSWRRELRGKKEFEVAEIVLAKFYEAKDRISAIRSPLSWANEGQSRKIDKIETPEQTRLLNLAYVSVERYQNHQEFFSKLNALKYRFMFIFGSDKAEPFDKLQKLLSEVLGAARLLGTFWVRQEELSMIEGKTVKLSEDITKYEDVIWEGKKPDPIAERVNELVSTIENICENHIKR